MKLTEVLSSNSQSSIFKKRKETLLGEGITHIEDADVEEFIHTVENLAKMIVSEKLDGANMTCGLNDKGKLFTGRGAHKGGAHEEFYSPKDWVGAMGGAKAFAPNGFASAHQALKDQEKIIQGVMKPGEMAECEVLFGTIPNAVAYDGKNWIAFLRMVEGPPERIKELESALRGKRTVVNSTLLTTSDGVSIKRESHPVEWNFTSTAFIDSNSLERVNVQAQLSKLKAYIRAPAPGFPEFSNAEVMSMPLTAIPKEQRDKFKKVKEEVRQKTKEDFQLPIKEELLNQFVRQLGPKLGKAAEEGGWIEGVVILDPQTKRQLKIVDKDVFTAVNEFNWQIRAAVGAKAKGANQLDVSIMGEFTQSLGKVFGIPNLFITAQTGRILKKLGGKGPEGTLANLIATLPKGQELSTYQSGILRAGQETIKKLDNSLKKYEQSRNKMKLDIDKGPVKKSFEVNEDIHKRTLQVYAESRAEVQDMMETTKRASSVGEVLAFLLRSKLRKV
jgi:hypothetical protein